MKSPSNARVDWVQFLGFYSEQNAGRKTRLGVFEKTDGGFDDYWVEDGLPLIGIDCDPDADPPVIEIMLEGYSHSILNPHSLKVRYSMNSDDDGLDVTARDDRTTILRFED